MHQAAADTLAGITEYQSGPSTQLFKLPGHGPARRAFWRRHDVLAISDGRDDRAHAVSLAYAEELRAQSDSCWDTPPCSLAWGMNRPVLRFFSFRWPPCWAILAAQLDAGDTAAGRWIPLDRRRSNDRSLLSVSFLFFHWV